MKETIKKIEELGFEVVVISDENVKIFSGLNLIARVNPSYPYSINTYSYLFIDLDDTTKKVLFDLIVQLYEEPKYYWVIALDNYDGDMYSTFNFSLSSKKWSVSDKSENYEFKTEFTEREFAELEKQLNIVGLFKRGKRVK